MQGSNEQFSWKALFRDGHVIEQPLGSHDDTLAALQVLGNYMYGTKDNPSKHYLKWFKLEGNGRTFTVDFDSDGDAYISIDDGKMVMTDYKIRSAQLVFIPDEITTVLGFGGVNTCDQHDGKWVMIDSTGRYKLASQPQATHGMIGV